MRAPTPPSAWQIALRRYLPALAGALSTSETWDSARARLEALRKLKQPPPGALVRNHRIFTAGDSIEA